MLKDFYQEELGTLREITVEFARTYPALAPILRAQGADSDVEQLLEEVTFLSSLVRQRLAESFPDLIQSLLQIFYPHLLHPMPSYTLMRFKSVQSFTGTVRLPKVSEVASIPASTLN
ncbi:MAG: hypothetical protein AMR96_04480 [Candidatus Adiutrix intracellularis]|jgi:type VI secretion system protein ImpG|nr:MAG: hypothetical protein AMR96_04480 [Candidatus Adiutrix intracellularis]MDR2826531.1 type VI secretion system baseplate subunit TssF [Candidatus Adiutrix intracellularis]